MFPCCGGERWLYWVPVPVPVPVPANCSSECRSGGAVRQEEEERVQ
uniref:Uncharacterized protein n=1 Tax=Arundo donax TaxID=35708 RepID=A0A0A9E145_ARUDO